ncbi:Tc toxin subunit A [Pseudomonas sp. NPDC087346]|uniref:Tc toxin subunit A n=1 Tax=Pseudomonas sp. NPDC087346 TaxID=3364438 RepID=UPI003802BB61
MTDSVIRPIEQLFARTFSEQQRETYADFCAYLKNDGSVFPVVERGVQGLIKDYQLSPDDARAFLRGANSLAIYIRRQFIEHSLTSDAVHVTQSKSGLLSMVAGPSYELLFQPNFDALCPPDALESITSPVAYLIELLRWIDDRISPEGDDTSLDLHQRRSDLKKLLVDFSSVHQVVPALDIIVQVLETFIDENAKEDEAGKKTDLEQALITAHYPNGLPYYQHWVTLDFVANKHGLSVGNFVHMVDNAYPYFLRSEAWDLDAGRAFAHASRLGPYQRQLLTAAPVVVGDSEARNAYCLHNFGTNEMTSQNLNQVSFFGERTRMEARAIEELLSIRNSAPTRSDNVTVYPEQTGITDSSRSGSVFINGAGAASITINYNLQQSGFLHRLSVSPDIIDPYERMNRKLRLDRWLGLPSEQVDALLAAAFNAEARGATPPNAKWISSHVVHALGLFQSLREGYGCSAEDFAAFIDQVSIYGRGEVLSQFDRTFNSQGTYRQPLMLDGGAFPILPVQGASDLTINQLCSGLGIDLKTYVYLAVAIARAHERSETLLRNPAIISSFYRLVKLPRLLGMTPVEGVLMLAILGGDSWLNGLAGLPQIVEKTGSHTTPDALNLIYAMHSCASWCKDRQMPVLWMLQQVSPPQALAVATEEERRFFDQIRNLLPAALFNNAGLVMAGVPAPVGLDWTALLVRLIHPAGLVITSPLPESEYLAFARERLDQAVKDGIGENDAVVRSVIVERMLTVLLQAREAQVSVVRECLAVYTGLDAERGLRVLTWSRSTVDQLLVLVLERGERDMQDGVRESGQPDFLLSLLADVRRRSAVVSKLDLSALLLDDFLQYGHTAWMDQDDRHLLSMTTLYYLTSLTRAFELSEQPAEKLLDYLREVNALPQPLTGDALKLVQQAAALRLAEFFDWSVQEVRECVAHIDPQSQILKSLSQLDLLMRIRVLAGHSGMDALTIFLVGNLPETIDKDAYRIAAEHAVLSLSETRATVVSFNDELSEPLVIMTCVVDRNDVIANKPDEKIIFTVTLRNADGAPLSGVRVHWKTSLGTMESHTTETNGTVAVQYLPGMLMGQERPLFWVPLISAQQAPLINITDDGESLFFPGPLMSLVPLEPVPKGNEVELSAVAQDNYTNLGRNRLVRWTVESDNDSESAVIRPEQNFTDSKGSSRVSVSSQTGGRFVVTATIESSGHSTEFEPFTLL